MGYSATASTRNSGEWYVWNGTEFVYNSYDDFPEFDCAEILRDQCARAAAHKPGIVSVEIWEDDRVICEVGPTELEDLQNAIYYGCA